MNICLRSTPYPVEGELLPMAPLPSLTPITPDPVIKTGLLNTPRVPERYPEHSGQPRPAKPTPAPALHPQFAPRKHVLG